MSTQAVGLSIGAITMGAVVPRHATATRRSVLTLYPHRPPELGLPSENPNINQRGQVITDFVERVGDPVGIVAADGSVHRGDKLVADALCALTYTICEGLPPAQPATVAYPAHWSPGAVRALRRALAVLPEWSVATDLVPVISDAEAALTALQHEPGLPSRGVIALCDFGATGTSITLADAADGLRQLGPTVRHTDLSGDLIDHALLKHVLADLPAGVDLSGTTVLSSLTRLRAACRAAKERLSATAVTTMATTIIPDAPGFGGTIRITRAELEDEIRRPLTEFMDVLHETLARSGVGLSDLAAAASVGGGAHIPLVTTTLSEHLRLPVITTPRPELTAATGAALSAGRGAGEDSATAVVVRVAAPAGEEASDSFPALAWSQEDPREDSPVPPLDLSTARPQLQFQPDETPAGSVEDRDPWYRRPLLAVAGLAAAISLTAGVIVLHRDSTPLAATTTTTATPGPGVRGAVAPSAAAPAAGNPAQPGQPQPAAQAPVPVAQSRPIEQQADQQPPAPAPALAANPPVPVVVAAPIAQPAPAPLAPPEPPPSAPAVVTTTPPPTTPTAAPPTTTYQPPPTQPPTTTHQSPPTTTQAPSTTEAPPPSSEPPSTTPSAAPAPHGRH
ncbi:MAG: hypothetical protein QOE41_3705 [Mycobacterium sp.]|jgi:hypothetical protein|nr:hypothetical protein [Mycobacterium sp.]